MFETQNVVEILALFLNSVREALCIGGGATGVENQFEVFAQLIQHVVQERPEREERLRLAPEPRHLDENRLIDHLQLRTRGRRQY